MKSAWKCALCVLICIFCLAGPAAIGQTSAVTLTISPTAITIHPGDQNIPVTANVNAGTYKGPIVVTLTDLPTGITVPPLTLAAGGSGTLNLSAAVSADQEDFPIASIGIDTATRTIHAVAVAGTTQVTVPVSLTVSLSNPSFAPAAASIDLPILSIDTSGIAITSTDNTVAASITITSADGQTSYLGGSSSNDGTAAIKVHGNTTAGMPKKPYEFKLGTSIDLLGTMGLTCPYIKGSSTPICDKSKTYILLANYDDKTLLRDWAASALANAIPIGGDYLDSPADSPTPSGTATLMPWAPHSLYVELYLNGQYQGNYQLIEKVNVDSHRLNITELSESDTSAADVTGGYFMEIDQHKDEAFVFTTPHGVPIGLQDPDFSPDPEVPAQTSYIENYVDTAENALFGTSYTDPTQGWRAYFDEASAVNFYIVNDLMGNNDGGAFYSSDYLYKDINNPLIYMGPVWDFDVSSGNVFYNAVQNPSAPWMQVEASWYVQWFTDPSFKADVAKQWNTLRSNGVITNWLNSIQQEAATLKQTQSNNNGRWPMQGMMVWPNSEAAGSYDGELSYMMTWLNARVSYLDSIFNNRPATTTTITAPSGTLRPGSPATFSAHVTATSGTPSGTVTFRVYSTNLSDLFAGTVDASGNATGTTSNLVAGTSSVQAIYSGDSEHAMSVSGASTFTVLAAQTNTTTVLNAADSAGSSFTVTVLASSGTAVPGGTVTFTSNGASIGTASLGAAGTATFVPAIALADGSDTIVATYGGDTNDLASTSNVVLVTGGLSQAPAPTFSPAAGIYNGTQSITLSDTLPGAAIYYTTDGSTPTDSSTLYSVPVSVTSTETINAIAVVSGYATSAVATAEYTIIPPNFTVAASAASVTASGGKATFNLTVTPRTGFTQQITLACSGQPSDDACTFSPATVTPNGSPVTVAVTVASSSTTAALGHGLPLWPRIGGGIAVALLLWPVRRRKAWLLVIIAGVLSLGGMLITGCSSGPSDTTARPYTLTVTATSGSLSQTTTVMINGMK